MCLWISVGRNLEGNSTLQFGIHQIIPSRTKLCKSPYPILAIKRIYHPYHLRSNLIQAIMLQVSKVLRLRNSRITHNSRMGTMVHLRISFMDHHHRNNLSLAITWDTCRHLRQARW